MGRPPKRVRNGREVERILVRSGCDIRRCSGSHRVGTLPDGSKLTYHDHGEYGKGIASKLTKALIAAGLLAMVISSAILLLN